MFFSQQKKTKKADQDFFVYGDCTPLANKTFVSQTNNSYQFCQLQAAKQHAWHATSL